LVRALHNAGDQEVVAQAEGLDRFDASGRVRDLELDAAGTQTARALGLERSHLYKKCQQLGIDLQAIPG
jgi:DNA-binding NtrC family response regulator